ncbi:NAD(P)-dependent oxidoreductase [Nocardia stercoris]|uniref:NAD-dependent epimerase/dehydratase family protein n=1 Tax=Nocardia stercoris TaxID=2483361 RepID=A0A3M2L0E5_9NOCA|nr:NAD(P)H-binding protein [Nocardia stercoris]RMI31199.1 NAD-dependent epimerase/dehydratase family protein [Nocardia stercoris]
MSPDQHSGTIVVFGAGGRAGRAILDEALRRKHHVTAVVRNPDRHRGLAARGAGVTVVAGDLTDSASVASVSTHLSPRRVTAVVNAVTPFSAPPESFADFDPDYYVHAVENLIRAVPFTQCRVIEIGLSATLRTTEGRLFENPTAFPNHLRPFAEARLRGLRAWQNQATDVDWLVLTPPPALSPQAPSTGCYHLADDRLDPTAATTPLSYPDLAVAVLDQIDTPTAHHRQVTAYGLPRSAPIP